MPEARVFKKWYAGDQGTFQLTAKDLDGDAVTVSGYFVTVGIGPNSASGVLFSKSYPASGVTLVSNGTGGIFDVALSGVDTANLSGDYHIEASRLGMVGTAGEGTDETVVLGVLRIRPTII